MVPQTQPTTSQYASAACHLDRRSDWRGVRIDGERYVVLQSGNSGRTYICRADGGGCSCPFYLRGYGRQCSHQLAISMAALEDELREQQAAQPAPAPIPTHGANCLTDRDAQDVVDAIMEQHRARLTIDDLYPKCKTAGCQDVSDSKDGYCSKCASEREWQARLASRRAGLGV